SLRRLPPHPSSTLFPYTTLFRSMRKETASNAASTTGRLSTIATVAMTLFPLIDGDSRRGPAAPRRFAPAAPRGSRSVRERTCRRSEEHTSELQSRGHLVCRLLLE